MSDIQRWKKLASPRTNMKRIEMSDNDLMPPLNDAKSYEYKMKVSSLKIEVLNGNKALDNDTDEHSIFNDQTTNENNDESIKKRFLRYQNVIDEYGSEPRKRYNSDNLPKLLKSNSPVIALPKYDLKQIKELRKVHDDLKKTIREYEVDRDYMNPIFTTGRNRPTGKKRQYDAETSPLKGWQRVGDKYHGDTEVFMSPVKHNLGILKPDLIDVRFSALDWILNISESIYYDNTILLLSRFRNDYTYGNEEHGHGVSDALRLNYTEITREIVKYWVNVSKLGEGAFGTVFRVQDSHTKEFYAVKHIKPTADSNIPDLLIRFIDFLKERNSLIRVYNYPFIIKFLSSFYIAEVDGLYLVFEYCVSDLSKFISKLDESKLYVKSKSFGWKYFKSIFYTNKKTLKPLETLYKNIKKQIKYNLMEIIIVYTFELLCGLDFLAQCEIVHRDMKPANVMISKTMHLKIGDLGLVVNKYYTTCEYNAGLLKPSTVLEAEKRRYKQNLGGTLMYMDPDVALYERDSDYMTDAYSTAMVVLEMMLLGETYFYDLIKDTRIRTEADIVYKEEVHKFILSLSSKPHLYEHHIKDAIVSKFDDENMKDLAKFICPLFVSRRGRKTDYLSVKKATFFKAEFFVSYVDIEKVQNFAPFSNLEITPHSVLTYNFPLEKFLDINSNPTSTSVFSDIIAEQENDCSERKTFSVEPGLNINLPKF